MEAVVAVALALGIIFLFLGDAGETVTVISMATDATVVATGLAAQP
ncbi:hypothetical protein ABI_14050 [Asticcacaulis biprosthecium C19]|uniref:Uncharacterized protein n=1 Tax=Asticcacaulis biprosthecium C19 TaxID=715226 RepID=F4QIH7_9CAUL|nr:hypothetical protein ABI_14050 [Asticcacaulis biprosthecium C19]